MRDSGKGMCVPIDVAIRREKAEKILKYEDLIIRTEHIWNENKKKK
jgi:hypothetical protein